MLDRTTSHPPVEISPVGFGDEVTGVIHVIGVASIAADEHVVGAVGDHDVVASSAQHRGGTGECTQEQVVGRAAVEGDCVGDRGCDQRIVGAVACAEGRCAR